MSPRLTGARVIVATVLLVCAAVGYAAAPRRPTPRRSPSPTAPSSPTPAATSLHAHGGGVLKVGDYYYWFGENRNADNTFRAVSVYRSTDLRELGVPQQRADPVVGRRAQRRQHRAAEGHLQRRHRPVRHVDAQGERIRLRRGPGRGRLLGDRRRRLHLPRQLPAAGQTCRATSRSTTTTAPPT